MKRIIFFICLLGSVAAIAQPSTSYLGGTNTLVISRNDFRVDSTLQMPLRDTTFPPSRVGIFVFRSADAGVYVSISTTAPKKWEKLAATASSVTWGSITGDLEDQTDLDAALDAKQNSITTGTTAQYLDGTLALRNFASEVTATTDPLYSSSGHSHNGLAPIGGTIGQVLKKNSSTNYDYSWQDDENDAGGSGDMLKATYDADNDAAVDNSEQLGGQLPSYYIRNPAGNYGNIQLNRNSAFATPASDSLSYTTGGGLVVKNTITADGAVSGETGNFSLGTYAGLFVDVVPVASVSTPSSGHGTIYEKSGDKKLWFKNSDGTDYDLTAAGTAAAQTKHITIESPSTLENIGLFFTDVAITITKVADVIVGSSSPSVTWQVNHASNRNGSPNTLFSSGRATTSASGATTTTFNDATIPANSWVWLTTSANAGSVTQLEVTIIYTID